MLHGKHIGVVVPAYNEESLITRVLSTMPEIVDYVVVVDDCSLDETTARVREFQTCENHHYKLKLIQHEVNRGVGAAIVTGYYDAVEAGMNVVAVMAGDAQMDPTELEQVAGPVVRDEADYVKGNRLFTGEAWQLIPKHRYLGNAVLSLLTKIASGYWHVADSQTGYTVISANAVRLLPLEKLYPRYGYPNHLLVMLNVYNMRVRDVPVRPVYNIGEKSGIRVWSIVPRLSWLLFKWFLWRMKEKYVIRDFHPLIFFYGLAFFLLALSVPLFLRIFIVWARGGFGLIFPRVNLLAFMFASIIGLQSLFFAMWFDMQHNAHLR